MALLLGLLLGAAVIVLVLFVVYRVIGRNPYACLERRHGDEMSTTPASVLTSGIGDDDDDDGDDGDGMSLASKLVDEAIKDITTCHHCTVIGHNRLSNLADIIA